MKVDRFRGNVKKFNPEFIFFYSIGRSGTAYLYQVFGHKRWKPQDVAYPSFGNTIVAHEKWAMANKEIEKLKLIKPTSPDGLKIQEKKIKAIRSIARSKQCEKIVITDSCFGRWCPYYIIDNCNYKAIFLGRNKDDVIKSWLENYKIHSRKYGKDSAKKLLAERFSYNYFDPLDKYTLLHVEKGKWKKYGLDEKFSWYYDEAVAKWTKLKESMDPNNFFETSYEEIITVEGLTKLSSFINLPFDYDLMKEKVNYNDYL